MALLITHLTLKAHCMEGTGKSLKHLRPKWFFLHYFTLARYRNAENSARVTVCAGANLPSGNPVVIL